MPVLSLQSMTEEERKLFRLYGKLPTNKDIIGQKLKVGPSVSSEMILIRVFSLCFSVVEIHSFS